MSHITRRSMLIGTSAIVPAALLAGCGIVTKQTINGVTTITINVAKIDAYGQAFFNATKLISGLPGIAASAPGMVVAALAGVVQADLAAFDKAAGGSVVLTFDATSVPSAVQSLVRDGETLLADARAAVPNVLSAQAVTANTYLNAVATLVSLFRAALGGVPAAAMAALAPDSEGHALAVLGVKAP